MHGGMQSKVLLRFINVTATDSLLSRALRVRFTTFMTAVVVDCPSQKPNWDPDMRLQFWK